VSKQTKEYFSNSQEQVTSLQHTITDRQPADFLQHYRMQLQQGRFPPGWQQSVLPEERSQLGEQFYKQYCMLRPEVPEVEAMRESISFETQAFISAQIKNQYVYNMNQKVMSMLHAWQKPTYTQPQHKQQQMHQRQYVTKELSLSPWSASNLRTTRKQANQEEADVSEKDSEVNTIFELSAEFNFMFAECQSSDVLQVLRDNWHHYS
jgi:hypothetical protein